MSLRGDTTGTDPAGRLQFLLHVCAAAQEQQPHGISLNTLTRIIAPAVRIDMSDLTVEQPNSSLSSFVHLAFGFVRRVLGKFLGRAAFSSSQDYWESMFVSDASARPFLRVVEETPGLCRSSDLPLSQGGGVERLASMHRQPKPSPPPAEVAALREASPAELRVQKLRRAAQKLVPARRSCRRPSATPRRPVGRASPDWYSKIIVEETARREGQALLALFCLYSVTLFGFILDMFALDVKWQSTIRAEALLSIGLFATAAMRLRLPDSRGDILEALTLLQALWHLGMTFVYPRPNFMWGFRTRAAWSGALPLTWVAAAYRVFGCAFSLALSSFAAYGAEASLDRRLNAEQYRCAPAREAALLRKQWRNAMQRVEDEREEQIKEFFLLPTV